MATRAADLDSERDRVPELLEVVREVIPGLSAEQQRAIVQGWQTQLAGVRMRFAKRRGHPTPAQRAKVFSEALTDASNEQILQDNGISRRSLYRYLKRGGS